MPMAISLLDTIAPKLAAPVRQLCHIPTHRPAMANVFWTFIAPFAGQYPLFANLSIITADTC
jgi:hypothetical protein